MAIELGSAYGKIVIDSSGVTVGVGNATKSFGSLSQAADKLGSSMQKIGGAMTLGLTLPILAFGTAAVREAAQSEAAFADLDAVIKSTGGAAGVTADAVKEYANKMQLLTKFSDDQIISGNAMLLTFTNIGKEIFPLASDATLDLAQKFGMDLSQASIMLGKALNDPVAGVGALRRIGVQLSDQQEQQIKDFMAVNDVASAQKIILDELSKEIGGVALAYGATFGGQLEIFNNRLNDVKEKIGMQLIPALIRFMDAAKPLLDWFSNASPATIDFIISLLGIIAAAGPVTTAIGTIVKVIGVFLPGGALSGVATFFSGTLLPAVSSFFTFITATAIPAIAAFVVANSWWIVPLLLVAGTVYLVYLAFKNNFMGITTTAQQLWAIMKWGWNDMWTKIKKGTSEGFSDIKNSFSKISIAFTNLVDAVRKDGYQFTLVFEDGSGAVMDFMVALGFSEQKVQGFLTALWGVFSPLSNAILLFEDGSGALLDLAVSFGIPEQAAQEFLSRIFFVVSSITQLFRGNLVQAVKDFAAALGITNPALENLVKRFQSFSARVTNYFKGIATTAQQLWAIIKFAFGGIGVAIDWVITKVEKLRTKLAELKLPKALTPGSPTPFEMGLRGIASAMDLVANKNIPNLQSGLLRPMQNNSSSQQQNITMQFANGLTTRQAESMIAQNNELLLRRLNRAMGGV